MPHWLSMRLFSSQNCCHCYLFQRLLTPLITYLISFEQVKAHFRLDCNTFCNSLTSFEEVRVPQWHSGAPVSFESDGIWTVWTAHQPSKVTAHGIAHASLEDQDLMTKDTAELDSELGICRLDSPFVLMAFDNHEWRPVRCQPITRSSRSRVRETSNGNHQTATKTQGGLRWRPPHQH